MIISRYMLLVWPCPTVEIVTTWSLVFDKLIVARLVSLPLDPILSQLLPVRTLTSYFFKKHFNVILPPMITFPKCSLLFTFSDQSFVCISGLPPSYNMSRQSDPPWFHVARQDNFFRRKEKPSHRKRFFMEKVQNILDENNHPCHSVHFSC
jgi:hypothetical protein